MDLLLPDPSVLWLYCRNCWNERWNLPTVWLYLRCCACSRQIRWGVMMHGMCLIYLVGFVERVWSLSWPAYPFGIVFITAALMYVPQRAGFFTMRMYKITQSGIEEFMRDERGTSHDSAAADVTFTWIARCRQPGAVLAYKDWLQKQNDSEFGRERAI